MNHPLTALHVCGDKLAAAAAEAVAAADLLTGARKTRALELAEAVRSALAVCARLEFALAAEQQSDEHESRYQR